MSRPKMSKKQKVINLLSKGENVLWKTLTVFLIFDE